MFEKLRSLLKKEEKPKKVAPKKVVPMGGIYNRWVKNDERLLQQRRQRL